MKSLHDFSIKSLNTRLRVHRWLYTDTNAQQPYCACLPFTEIDTELYALEDTTLSSPDSVVPATYGQLRAKVYIPIVTNIFLTLPSRRSMEEYQDLTFWGAYRTYLSRILYAAAKILRLTWQRVAIFQDGNPLTITKDTRWL